MIPLFWPQVYKEEWLEELGKVFSGRWLGQGPLVDEFERRFGEKFGFNYCLATNSGSSALELAYDLIGIGPGDKVITTVFTCTATNIPLVRRGAEVIFADIGDDLLIDPGSVARWLTDYRLSPKAIVVVTLGGLPVDKGVYKMANAMGIPVVVDAAQSLGVVEPFGDYVCYSYQAIKHFTTGDGGMLVTRNAEDHERAKRLRWFGIDREAKKRAGWRCVVNHQMAMEIEEPGHKFHMNDIAAAMGLVGLRHSDEILEHRKNLCAAYAAHLGMGVRCVFGGSHWLMGVLVDNRDWVMETLRAAGIECDPVQLRNDCFKVFGGRRSLPNMDRLEDKYLYLPLNCKVTVDDVLDIAKAVRHAAQGSGGYNECPGCGQVHFAHQRCR